MEIMTGSCRFGLWHVHVAWKGDLVHHLRFAREGIDGPVPDVIRQYCAGKPVDPVSLRSIATAGDTVSAAIYRAVRSVPYGETATYGEIALRVGTSPRAVGGAMARNPTPLVVPCHRIVAQGGIGGFSPAVEIKEALLRMEARERGKGGLNRSSPHSF
ncbi:MAG: MGMT family protein [Methanomicrobiaceae archaeon]|uniref:Methylated-dna--protein-cysteine methyltransferase n=1 Tax=hydrocarbon metagenome TaxID=938273 RepID=A0A0W8FFI4_9ZZZZ|nr:MGMT family protein [Methanomicrobiaceae archaeon]MDD5419311.1 MGMT family protein [Methanomicrobiaceae archaeon]